MPQSVLCPCGTRVEQKTDAESGRVNCPTCGTVYFFSSSAGGDDAETYGIAGGDDFAVASPVPAEDDHVGQMPGWLDRYRASADARNADHQKLLEIVQKTGATNAAHDPHAAALYLALTNPSAETTVAALAKIAASGHPQYAPIAATFLSYIGPSEAASAQQVLAMLQETQSVQTIELLAACLQRIGPTPVAHVRSLAAILGGRHTGLAVWAAQCLKLIGPPGKHAVDALLKALKVSSHELRLAAIDALGIIGDQAERVLPVLVQALKHPHPEYRRRAAQALGRFGARATSAIAALKALAHDEDPTVVQAGSDTIAAISAASAAPPAPAAPAAANPQPATEPISFRCQCGGKLKIKPALAGKKAKCPACGDVFIVPMPAGGAGEKTCPVCLAAVPAAVVLCAHCGLDFRTGKPFAAPTNPGATMPATR